MKFYLTDADKYMEVTMRTWQGSCWTPDFFHDMETWVPAEYEKDPGDVAYKMTAKEFCNIVNNWEDYCRCEQEEDGIDTVLFVAEV